MRRLATAFFLACLASIASAAPMSVFGLELGQPLALPSCPFKTEAGIKLYDLTPATTCVQDAAPLNGYQVPVRRVVFGQGESPAIVKNWTVFPLEQDGKVIGIHWITAGVSARLRCSSSCARSTAPPTDQSTHQVETAAGGTFDAITAVWSLPDLRVRFIGVGARITMGEVYVDLPVAAAMRAAWNQHEAAGERKL